MNEITRAARRVSGSIFGVTSHSVAQAQAIKRLKAYPDDLIDEIEQGIAQERGTLRITARAGDYRPEVVAQVAELYRNQGWSVRVDGYWMTLE